MAYNRHYNPDELPRFAEPEPKGPGKSPTTAAPPPSSRYETKPPPPRPLEHRDPYASQPPSRPLEHRSSDPYGAARLSPRQAAPPDRYGMSPPPSATVATRPMHHNLPPASSRPPPSPTPRDSSADPTLLPLFRAVDKDGTGQLSERELSAALVNGDWTSFDPQTVRMMIRMFDTDRSGSIGFEEFCGLWSFLASWRSLFNRFDTDRSGNICLDEFSNALVAFRYRLSDRFVEILFRTYDKRNEGVMSFDLFVQACISLKRMTDVFKRYDDDRDGYITLSFEDFLTEILRQLR
ncbi:EF-hand [Trichocladium antarcticum]|uniref:EF-hand n=1 Tax=Trichocladium antarcticum TaxID=1450529 RepID=A0AAN6ZBP2_9PEZI|nr:EF-hand [Trichocladium antarcticum]